MLATHRVVDNGYTIGFIVDGVFASDKCTRQNIGLIDNLRINRQAVIKSKGKLPEVSYEDVILNGVYKKLVYENPIERDIQKELLHWKNNPGHKVLQLNGVRQVGKTTELLKFAYRNYKYVIPVNLASDMYDFSRCYLKSRELYFSISHFDMNAYCAKANLHYYVNSKDIVLIIDEIQENREVYKSLKDFADSLECDIIVTGSYLGKILLDTSNEEKEQLEQIHNWVDTLTLGPLTFDEFCRTIKDKVDNKGINDSDCLEIYKRIGGYPSVVREYLRRKQGGMFDRELGKIELAYKDEARTYFTNEVDLMIFEMVFDVAFKMMCDNTYKVRTDIIRELANNDTESLVSVEEMKQAVEWLTYMGVIKVDTVKSKIYFIDCGLASYLGDRSSISKESIDRVVNETFKFNK